MTAAATGRDRLSDRLTVLTGELGEQGWGVSSSATVGTCPYCGYPSLGSGSCAFCRPHLAR